MDRVVNSPGIENDETNSVTNRKRGKKYPPHYFLEDVNKFADNREREKKLTYFMRTVHDPKIKSKNGIK